MPTDVDLSKEGMIYQREQYQKGGIGRRYWDYKDNLLIKQAKDSDIILDVGCGEGILLEKLINMFPEKKITGIDAEAENLEICQTHGLAAELGSVYDLEIDDESVDCAIFSEVIEHLDEPDRAIGELARILKKGGTLILMFPNDVTFKLYRIMTLMIKEAFYETGHIRQWTPRDIKKTLAGHGFRIDSRQNIPFFLWSLSLHHLVAAKKR